MSIKTGFAGAIVAGALCAAASPVLAWEQLDLGANSAGQPTYAPKGQLTFDNLPGVRPNPGGQQAAENDCSESRYYTNRGPGFGDSGTVTECNFGKFSLRTYRSGDGNNGSGYNPFPVPGPLRQDGPPPGSGGYAPTQHW